MSRIIDFHAHVFPDDVAASALPGMQERAGVTASFDGTVRGLIATMDAAGVSVTVTQPVATSPSQEARINTWAATTASERIVPFGSVHPDTADPAAAVGRVASLGLRGIKLHPEFQTFRPDDPRLDPLYDAAGANGLIVLFHAGLDIAIPTDHGRPETFARMLDRHPDLTVVLAHMGGWGLWEEVREHLVGREVYLDTSFARGHMSDDSFLEMVCAHGVDRILFGTDGPWADASAEVPWLTGLPLAQEALDAIMGGTASRLLGI